MTIVRRNVTVAEADGVQYARANVWTENGYCSKTFLTGTEAARWMPEMQPKERKDV